MAFYFFFFFAFSTGLHTDLQDLQKLRLSQPQKKVALFQTLVRRRRAMTPGPSLASPWPEVGRAGTSRASRRAVARSGEMWTGISAHAAAENSGWRGPRTLCMCATTDMCLRFRFLPTTDHITIQLYYILRTLRLRAARPERNSRSRRGAYTS